MARSFQPFKDDFLQITREIVWCTKTTVDARCRPRSRVTHPSFEIVADRPVGQLMAARTPLKRSRVAADPHVAVSC